ncbi:MAG: GDP-mannose 4,6-dehydratase [Candidatus Melainabacteria bacterium]|nr:GDP-mannose 4,6-dehydratase [Candidatus Melainabacteria bacterium]
MKLERVLVTGGAGFIGSHLVERLIFEEGVKVTVLDNFNDFYDPGIKRRNLDRVRDHENFALIEGDIRNRLDVQRAFAPGNPGQGPVDAVVHLAAMAGVRPSIENPGLYMDVNIMGTQNLLDCAAAQSVRSQSDGSQTERNQTRPLFVFASSSSVYGERQAEHFRESDRTDRPISPYAASKMAGEMLCHTAHRNTGLDVVCLRFFTVFGPRQRPDLAIHKFCRLIDEGKPVEVYGDGSTQRDYTYIQDIVDGIMGVFGMTRPCFEIINLGRSEPVVLKDMIACIEKSLGKKADIVHKPMQKGDVPNTFAGIDRARQLLAYHPTTGIEEGIEAFVAWYRENQAGAVAVDGGKARELKSV